ncbi:MAG: peptidase S10 [Akkermansiaceae bacterium]|nr:peptidase S10 [Akkermansiaceae bacterium]
MRILLPFSVLFALGLAVSPAQDKEKPDKKDQEEEQEEKSKDVSQERSITLDGKKIDYTVTAAKLQLKTGDGKPRADIFHISYIRTGVDKPQDRPVMFAFNGGPGSSSVWLHLGALGPRLVPTSPDGTKPLAPPHRLIDNPHSILDVADLVFIDPVSTGYSRVEGDAKPSEFHGLTQDIESVGDFIRRWVTENDRWGSPKYLLGESYGGIRAAGLSDHLQSRYGMSLNGVVMLSSLLDFRTLRGADGDGLVNIVYLPAFAAVAHHHGKVKGDLAKLLKDSRDYAHGEYATLLLRGNEVDETTRQKAAIQLSKMTGISTLIWLETDLRLPSSRFRKELLRAEGKVLGRFDARVAWAARSKDSDYASYDPSYAVAYGAFSTAMLDYLSADLGWEEDNPYEILTGKVRPWKWGRENSIVNLTSRISNAMVENPKLKVLVMCGHTDLATPPTGIEHSFRQMLSLPAEQRSNVEFTYYDAGHMFYLNEPDLAKMRKDLVKFLAPTK